MRNLGWKILFWSALITALAAVGCHSERRAGRTDDAASASQINLGSTVGSLAQMAKAEPIAVEGIGLVVGLRGTGSGYCPPQIRAYLKQYILAQLPTEKANLDALLDSKNTAVVQLESVIPAAPSADDHFDVRVSLIPGSEATSIRGGWLNRAELVAKGTFGAHTKPLATVSGAVFINPIGADDVDLKSGAILGGGRCLHDYTSVLRLRRGDYRTAGVIRNRLSERYGRDVARAITSRDIEVQIPPSYRRRKERFLAMVPATYIEITEELVKARADALVHQLTVPGDRQGAEIALEAVGKECIGRLVPLLTAPDAEIRLRAGRCMLALEDDRGFAALRELAVDAQCPFRREALDAIMVSARRNDAVALACRLLRDTDVAVVLAAYEHLRQLDDPAVSRELVGRSFYLERVLQTDRQAIFVSRSGDPRVVLFGASLECSNNIFVESPDQSIMVNARAEQNRVSIVRKHPTRPGVIGPVATGFEVSEIVRTLGGEAATGAGGQVLGMGASYEEVIAVLEQLVAKGAVTAEFWPGPLAKIGLPVKK